MNKACLTILFFTWLLVRWQYVPAHYTSEGVLLWPEGARGHVLGEMKGPREECLAQAKMLENIHTDSIFECLASNPSPRDSDHQGTEEQKE